jgi:hypothetical protein
LELIMSISEQVVRSCGLREPTSRYTVGAKDSSIRVMAIAGALRKRRTIAGVQHRLAAVPLEIHQYLGVIVGDRLRRRRFLRASKR